MRLSDRNPAIYAGLLGMGMWLDPVPALLFFGLADGLFHGEMLFKNGVQIIRDRNLVFSQNQFAFRRNILAFLTHP